MLASARLTRPNLTRRAAFTLVEVLVVVAIVVILASIGTLATFKFLEDAKVDAARQKAEQLQMYAKTWMTRNDGAEIQDISVLAQYAEDDQKALFDPWGNPYQITWVSDPVSGRQRLFIFTVRESNGQQLTYGAPKDLEPAGQ
jgi:general secretion pathway protein G